MVGQQSRNFSVTQVDHEKKYRKKFQGATFVLTPYINGFPKYWSNSAVYMILQ